MVLWQRFAARCAIWQRPAGQGLVEYALLLIFVAVVLLALLYVLGPGIVNTYELIVEELEGVVSIVIIRSGAGPA
jgi:Flp pilus assembly pilin Flp